MLSDKFTGNDWLLQVRGDFESAALQLYRFQSENVPVYRAYHEALGRDPSVVRYLSDIPFLPISFFKSHRVLAPAAGSASLTLFESSGTTGMEHSRHFVPDLSWYDSVALEGFSQYYGSPEDWVILALLPSYLERSSSSLVHMVKTFMDKGFEKQMESGFYLHEFGLLADRLRCLRDSGRRVLLLGVTFALLDFAENYPMDLSAGVVVMETGGMKGRREEWTREQVHAFLKARWQLVQVHSEYGMTELLSQAYAAADGFFRPVDTMKVLVRDLQDPLSTYTSGIGALNVIDLANTHSCAFIATEDIARVHADGVFEVLGRMDFAALRGCSLLTV